MQVGEYEGDHLAVYVNDFLGMYRRARAVRAGRGEASIVWNNPCFGWARGGGSQKVELLDVCHSGIATTPSSSCCSKTSSGSRISSTGRRGR